MSDQNSLGLRAFRQHLQEELKEICREHGWNYDDMPHRGYALQHWVARLFCQADPGIDTDPETAVLSSKDLGADVVLEDPTRQHLRIVQCKASSLGKEGKLPPLDETDLNDFFHRHALFMDRKWVTDHASEDAFILLGDYREQIKSGWTVEYFFVTTLPSTDRHQQLANSINEEYQGRGDPVSCRLLDLHGLKDFHNQVDSMEDTITDEIRIDLPTGLCFEKREPHRTLVAVVKGNTLRNLYKTHKESLFTYNIRDFLGKARAINRKMIDTARTSPDEFFYFNNGVSAVCSHFSLDRNVLTVRRLQIINGAQTVGALYAADDDADVQVLFRLTESDKAKLNENIIRYNNTQNTINSSDFRSNDRIQIWIEDELSRRKARGPLPIMRYSRKRNAKRSKGTTVITLEDMAKIQYSFLVEPTIIYESPKSLWTYQSEGGKYEQAFGVSDELLDIWPPDRFNMGLLGVAFYLRVTEAASDEMHADEDLWYLKRLRYHLLAFAGLLVRGRRPVVDVNEAISDQKVFDQLWDRFWPSARQVLIMAFVDAKEAGTTVSAFARSPERWEKLKKQFSQIMRIAAGS